MSSKRLAGEAIWSCGAKGLTKLVLGFVFSQFLWLGWCKSRVVVLMRRVGSGKPVVTYPQVVVLNLTLAFVGSLRAFWAGFATGACCILWILLQ